MKLIKITSKGSLHFKMSDGRIGTVSESGYVRVNTKQDNFYHRKPLFYQINKKTPYVNERNPNWVNFKREVIPNHVDRIKFLYAFNQKTVKMKLTLEEIKDIANRLDKIIGDNFNNAICNIINEREFGDSKYMEVSDQDVRRIKDELKRIL